MRLKLISAEGHHGVSFPSESARWVPQKHYLKSFVIALLLVVSFLTFLAAILVYYPQKVDAFLNSDDPVESKHVVTSNNESPKLSPHHSLYLSEPRPQVSKLTSER